MGLWDWLSGKKISGKTETVAKDDADTPSGFLSDVIDIPSRGFFGMSSKSPNGHFAIAWRDGGPDRARKGHYILLDRGNIVAEGKKMPRPNDGKVADNGVFILNDWGAIETLNGTFAAFRPDGTLIMSRKFKANLFNNGLSADGRFAVCQTANAPSEDGGRLTVFDLTAGKEISRWQAESGWASFYEFPADGQTIRLGYRDRGTFSYALDGTFIDRTKWLAAGLQKGDLYTVETLLAEGGDRPARALIDLLLPAIDIALAGMRETDVKWRARAFKLRGLCFEAIDDSSRALECYDQALAFDPKIGVKRKAAQLRKVLT